jgi:hypothetical protein
MSKVFSVLLLDRRNVDRADFEVLKALEKLVGAPRLEPGMADLQILDRSNSAGLNVAEYVAAAT